MGTNTHQRSPYVEEVQGQEEPQVPENLGYGASREDLLIWVEEDLNPVLDEAEGVIRSCPVCGEEKENPRHLVCEVCYGSFEEQKSEVDELLTSAASPEEVENAEVNGTTSLTEWARTTAEDSIPEEALQRCRDIYPEVWRCFRLLDQASFNVSFAELKEICREKSMYLGGFTWRATERKTAIWREVVPGNRQHAIRMTLEKTISFLENVLHTN